MTYTQQDCERDKGILEGAPEGATHVDCEGDYWLMSEGLSAQFWEEEYEWSYAPPQEPLRSLTDIRNLVEMYEARQWISVEDRLPKKDGEYLCYVKDSGSYGYVEPSEYEAVGKYSKLHKRFFTVSGRYSNPCVTHWMPLPTGEK